MRITPPADDQGVQNLKRTNRRSGNVPEADKVEPYPRITPSEQLKPGRRELPQPAREEEEEEGREQPTDEQPTADEPPEEEAEKDEDYQGPGRRIDVRV